MSSRTVRNRRTHSCARMAVRMHVKRAAWAWAALQATRTTDPGTRRRRRARTMVRSVSHSASSTGKASGGGSATLPIPSRCASVSTRMSGAYVSMGQCPGSPPARMAMAATPSSSKMPSSTSADSTAWISDGVGSWYPIRRRTRGPARSRRAPSMGSGGPPTMAGSPTASVGELMWGCGWWVLPNGYRLPGQGQRPVAGFSRNGLTHKYARRSRRA